MNKGRGAGFPEAGLYAWTVSLKQRNQQEAKVKVKHSTRSPILLFPVTVLHSQRPFHSLMEKGGLIVLTAPPAASFGESPPLVPVF